MLSEVLICKFFNKIYIFDLLKSENLTLYVYGVENEIDTI